MALLTSCTTSFPNEVYCARIHVRFASTEASMLIVVKAGGPGSASYVCRHFFETVIRNVRDSPSVTDYLFRRTIAARRCRDAATSASAFSRAGKRCFTPHASAARSRPARTGWSRASRTERPIKAEQPEGPKSAPPSGHHVSFHCAGKLDPAHWGQ